MKGKEAWLCPVQVVAVMEVPAAAEATEAPAVMAALEADPEAPAVTVASGEDPEAPADSAPAPVREVREARARRIWVGCSTEEASTEDLRTREAAAVACCRFSYLRQPL